MVGRYVLAGVLAGGVVFGLMMQFITAPAPDMVANVVRSDNLAGGAWGYLRPPGRESPA